MTIHYNAAAATRQDTQGSNAASAGKLLIVDDLSDNRAVLSRRFVRRGFEVVEVATGEEALQAILDQEFDLILLDVMMPGMDGSETLRHIRLVHPAALLPVIMVTAKSQPEDIVSALSLGANDYVTKPVDFAVALARVNKQLERRRAELELRETNASLEGFRTQLEQRVNERSAKLMKANAAIQAEVARRVASEDRIAYMAHHDTLTGLPNRFTFDKRLDAARQCAREDGAQMSLLFIDLDGFKNVNDTLGHAIGDELLRTVASSLSKAIGPKDFCARLGGDEFAIVHMSEEVTSTSAALAEKVISTISGCQTVGGNQVFIGASIGIAVASGGDADAGDLLKRADLAMYRAKADGRGVYRFFELEMRQRVEMRRSLELDLRAALAQGGFELFYQPVVDLMARRITGLEALMRWNHKTRGFVPPIEFIALAEETGLIVPMGEWALRQACMDAARWPDSIRVAINLSPIQFRSMNLVPVIVDALKVAGIGPERLEMEITESVMLGSNLQTLTVLTSLREMGVYISLDDFGTGYAGLGYFRVFKFDRVKIDQSFIQDMSSRPESRAIIKAAIGLGEDMGIGTIAEGVETDEQLANLLKEGCSHAQGFLFSVPRPGSDVLEMIANVESRL